MCVPVLKEILSQNPDYEIVMISRKPFEPLFQGVERLTFKGVDFKDYKGILGIYRLSKEISKEFPNALMADLHNVLRTKILNFFLGLKKIPIFKIDKGKKDKKKLTDIWQIDKKQLKKTTERYADVFRKIGLKVELSHQLTPVFLGEKSGVGFAPFAQHKGKMLGLEKSFELAKKIAKTEKIYFFGGGKKEIEILNQWEQKIPNSENLAGKLSLKEEIEKIAQLRVMIAMDSANMHFASLVGTRCVSIWGQTHFFAGFLGFGQNKKDAVHIEDLTCRPCSVFGDKTCFRGDWACLEEIQIATILEKINK